MPPSFSLPASGSSKFMAMLGRSSTFYSASFIIWSNMSFSSGALRIVAGSLFLYLALFYCCSEFYDCTSKSPLACTAFLFCSSLFLRSAILLSIEFFWDF